MSKSPHALDRRQAADAGACMPALVLRPSRCTPLGFAIAGDFVSRIQY